MSQQTFSGTLQKMVAQIAADHSPSEVVYQLPVGEHRIPLNPLLGKPITLHFQQAIFCCHCGKKPTKALVKVTAIRAFVSCHSATPVL